MDKSPLSKLDPHQAAIFAFKLYLPALRRYISANSGFSVVFENVVNHKFRLVHQFFNKPGNSIGLAVFKATPYYHNPFMLWEKL